MGREFFFKFEFLFALTVSKSFTFLFCASWLLLEYFAGFKIDMGVV
jgi:hypothetical protein